MKSNKYKCIVKNIYNSPYYKISILFNLLIAIYGCLILGANQDNYFYTILITHSNPYFNVLFVSLIMINSINTLNILSKYNLIVRLDNKKNYIKTLIKTIIHMNIISIFSYLLMYFSLLNITQISYIKIENFSMYNINIIIYMIFYLIRYFVFILLSTTIFSLLLIKFKKTRVYPLIIIFIVGFLFAQRNIITISEFSPFIWKYLTLANFGTFTTDVNYSILYCLIMEIIIYLIYKLIVYSKKIKFNIKYFILNDINFVIRKHWKLILIFILLPIIILTLSYTKDEYILISMQKALGININNKDFLLPYLFYIFNFIAISLFSLDLFIKDYNNITNIYLRYNYKKFFFIKTLSQFIILVVILFLQYQLISLFSTVVYKTNSYEIFRYFINSIFMNMFYGLLIIILYITVKISKKYKIIPIIFSLIYIFIIPLYPINISKNNNLLLILVMTILIFVINKIIIKNNKKIIQELGEV